MGFPDEVEGAVDVGREAGSGLGQLFNLDVEPVEVDFLSLFAVGGTAAHHSESDINMDAGLVSVDVITGRGDIALDHKTPHSLFADHGRGFFLPGLEGANHRLDGRFPLFLVIQDHPQPSASSLTEVLTALRTFRKSGAQAMWRARIVKVELDPGCFKGEAKNLDAHGGGDGVRFSALEILKEFTAANKPLAPLFIDMEDTQKAPPQFPLDIFQDGLAGAGQGTHPPARRS